MSISFSILNSGIPTQEQSSPTSFAGTPEAGGTEIENQRLRADQTNVTEREYLNAAVQRTADMIRYPNMPWSADF